MKGVKKWSGECAFVAAILIVTYSNGPGPLVTSKNGPGGSSSWGVRLRVTWQDSRAIAANNTQPYVMVDNYITLCRNILSIVTRPYLLGRKGLGKRLTWSMFTTG